MGVQLGGFAEEWASCLFWNRAVLLVAGEGLQSAVVESRMTVEFIFTGDVDKRSELHDLSLVPIVCVLVALQLLLLPAEEFPLRPCLLQQLPVIILQSAVSVLNDLYVRVCASECGGGLRIFEGSSIVD